MKSAAFLRETAWVLYALYFKPSTLATQLRARLYGLSSATNPINLLGIVVKFNQASARRYLGQMALLCTLAASPVLVLAPTAPAPPSVGRLWFLFILIALSGLGLAVWSGALGPAAALALALASGQSAEPTIMLDVLFSTEFAELLRAELLPGLTVGAATGLLVGVPSGIWWRRRSLERALIVALGGVAGILAAGLAVRTTAGSIPSIGVAVAGAVAFGVGGGATIGIAGGEMTYILGGSMVVALRDNMLGLVMGFVAGLMGAGVILGVALGMALGAASGATFTMALGAAVAVLIIVTVVVAAVTAVVVTDFTTLGEWESVTPGVALFVLIVIITGVLAGIGSLVAVVMAAGVAFGVALVVAGGMAMLPTLAPTIVAVEALILGFVLGSRRWGRGQFVLALVILFLPATVFLPEEPLKAALWLLASSVGFLRLPLFLTYVIISALNNRRQRQIHPGLKPASDAVDQSDPRPQRTHFDDAHLFVPWRLDELIPLPLPYLDRTITLIGQLDPVDGSALIEEVAATWRQGWAAERAVIRLVTDRLATVESEKTIAAADNDLAWLPESLPFTIQPMLLRLRTVSQIVATKLTLTDDEQQLTLLSQATAELDQLIRQQLPLTGSFGQTCLLPIAERWRTILNQAITRLPNPYRSNEARLFVGREALFQQLEAHLKSRRRQPALILYGQRGMGKSSLLSQFPQHFDDQTVPVRVDCRAVEMQQNDAAFLFHVTQVVRQQAAAYRGLELPPPISPTRMNFTAFNYWLEMIIARLDRRMLLLSLDDYEVIGQAVADNQLSEGMLGFLRNLMRHHPQITLLLAGSRSPQTIGHPWSNYLIDATVLPIGYLQPAEVRQLVTRPISGFPLVYQPGAVEHIIALTRCQPLLVQSLCRQLVNYLNEQERREAAIDDIEAAAAEVVAQDDSAYFSYPADDIGSVGQSLLTRLACVGPGAAMIEAALTENDPTRRTALVRLLEESLLERGGGGLNFQIELTRRWWADYGPD